MAIILEVTSKKYANVTALPICAKNNFKTVLIGFLNLICKGHGSHKDCDYESVAAKSDIFLIEFSNQVTIASSMQLMN